MSAKKNILIIVNSTKISGAEISLFEVLDKLSPNKYSLHLIAPVNSDLYDLLKHRYTIKVLPLKRFKKSKNLVFFLKSIISLIIACIKISLYIYNEKIDLVYSNSIQAHLYTLLPKFFTGIKIIWQVRDNMSNKFITMLSSACSDRIICVSQFIYDQIPGSISKKILIYNGIDTNKWRLLNPTKLLKSQINKENFLLVGCIGQLVPWKKHLDLIDSAEIIKSSFKNVHFLIVGDDLFNENTDYVDQLKRKILEKKLSDFFSFVGYKKNIAEIISNLDVIVHCAYEEPFGRVLIEGMAMQKPIVAYNSGGPAEIVIDNVTGYLVESSNINMLSEKLLELLCDEAKRIKFGQRARLEVEKKFPIELNVKMIEAVFDQ